jgi:hypothetical protein
MVVIFKEGLVRAAIRWSMKWGAIGSHLVVRVLGVAGRVRG